MTNLEYAKQLNESGNYDMLVTLCERLNKGKVHFTFTKKDGTTRKAYGTVEHDFLTANANFAGNGKPDRVTNTIKFYDIEAEGWRSFSPDSLVSIDD
jgi:hypothetical protein